MQEYFCDALAGIINTCGVTLCFGSPGCCPAHPSLQLRRLPTRCGTLKKPIYASSVCHLPHFQICLTTCGVISSAAAVPSRKSGWIRSLTMSSRVSSSGLGKWIGLYCAPWIASRSYLSIEMGQPSIPRLSPVNLTWPDCKALEKTRSVIRERSGPPLALSF